MQLLDGLEEMRRYWKSKEEACSGGGYGPVVRRTTEWTQLKNLSN